MMKLIIFLFPIFIFGQQSDEWSNSMQSAMKDIQNNDFKSAIINLDKSLEIVPKNWSALYFKGYSQIIIGKKEDGCKTLIDAIYYGGSNLPKDVFAKKCSDYNPNLNLDNFNTGKFSLQILDDPLVYNFERKNDLQYESFEGKIYIGKIVWYNKGEYTIIPDEETKKLMPGNSKFLIRALKIENNEYLYEKIIDENVQYGIVKKLNN